MIKFPIDLVVPYVNNTSQVWQNTYQKFCKENGYGMRLNGWGSERYRDWGFFKYFIRGIDKHLPFINKIYLILQDKDQIPLWLDVDCKDIVIVYHKDFIPVEYLPTYNSTTIEMFLHKIKGLCEHFIYTNDDMYAMRDMKPEDFFTEDGKVKVGFKQRVVDGSQFSKVCYKCFSEIQAGFGKPNTTQEYLVPFHEWTPMRKSHLILAQKKIGYKIQQGITNFRHASNYNQYIYPLYELCSGNAAPSSRIYAYANMEDKVEEIGKAMLHDMDVDIFVLNDNEKTNVPLWINNNAVRNAFDQKFPDPSRYEDVPKVSVCICAFNAQELLPRCIKSIPNRKDVEIILLDDKSTDNTLQVAIETLAPYVNYTIFSNPKNMGVGVNRNILMAKARGNYIFFLDSDDYIYTDVFEDIIDHKLSSQKILSAKYIRNDGFSEYPTIYRGVFIDRAYGSVVQYNPKLRCYEDVDYKKRLIAFYGSSDDTEYEDQIIYHYNKPRIGSITWDYRKALGDPSYQKDEELWEKYRRGKRG